MNSDNSVNVELFAYPWDILDEGIESFVDRCQTLGIDRVHVTTVYHSGKFFLPRNRGSRVYFPESGCAYLKLPLGNSKQELCPPLNCCADEGWEWKLGRAAASAGISLAAWTVFHHNSALGTAHPHLTVKNLFGDRYPYALCPSHPKVQDYSVQLATALHSLSVFQALDLESIGYLGYFHGHHHEVTAAPLGGAERFLLSLCFCEACTNAAAKAGIHLQSLAAELGRLILARANADDVPERPGSTGERMATLLALRPELGELVRLRLNTVSTLVSRIRDAVAGTAISVFTSSLVGAPSNIWMEGVGLDRIAAVADQVQLLAYAGETTAANSDLLFCLALVPDPGKVNLTLNLSTPDASPLDSVLARVEFALRLGVRRFSVFNYGMLGEARLQWVRRLADFVASHAAV